MDERCVFFIHRCLLKPDEAHVALRLFRVGAIHGLAQIVVRYARSADRLAYNHAINCLVIFSNIHSGKYHTAIIDEGAEVLMELRAKMKELESYAKKRHSTNFAEQVLAGGVGFLKINSPTAPAAPPEPIGLDISTSNPDIQAANHNPHRPQRTRSR